MTKKLFTFVFLALISASNIYAQTYIRTATGANNIFPFGSATNRVQYLYVPADFAPAAPMGTITKVYFKAASTVTTTYTNMTINIGTTTLTGMPTGASPWITGLSPAFFSSSHAISVTSGNWFAFTLSTPFFWDGTSNLIIDVFSSTTGSMTLEQGALGGNRRLWGTSAGATSTGGGTGSASFALDIIPGSPCTKAIATAATTISSTAAQVNWNAVPGSVKYEYVIDTTAPGQVFKPIVTTTATSAFVTGLIPGKVHYLRVRNYCSTVSYSLWDTIAFTTLAPCSKPSGFLASSIDSTSANIQWTPATNVIQYKYLVDKNRNTPSSSNPGIVTTTLTSHALTGLTEGSLHYVHIRAKCVQNDSSAWSLDSFRTPIPCRKPVLSLTHLNNGTAIVDWPVVTSAIGYDYYIGKNDAPPAMGTPVINNFVQTPFLTAATTYNIFVRCNCVDYNIATRSDWAKLEFTTTALGIPATGKGDIAIDVYPNPVTDLLSVRSSGIAGRDAQLSVTDLAGKVIYTLPMQAALAEIDMKGLQPGVYIIKYTDSEQVKTIKVTRQ